MWLLTNSYIKDYHLNQSFTQQISLNFLLQPLFVVQRNFLPFEVKLSWHALMSDIWQSFPCERLESAVARSGTASDPEKVLRISFKAWNFAIYKPIAVGWISLITSRCDSYRGITFLIYVHPIFDLLFIVHSGIIFFESDCTGITLVVIGNYMR